MVVFRYNDLLFSRRYFSKVNAVSASLDVSQFDHVHNHQVTGCMPLVSYIMGSFILGDSDTTRSRIGMSGRYLRDTRPTIRRAALRL